MAKVIDNKDGSWSFFCPGCGYQHMYWTMHTEHYKGPVWQFNGDVNNPSFHASLLNYSGVFVDPKWPHRKEPGDTTDYSKPPWSTRCHLYVTNGKINYCGDCTHEYNGRQGVEMVDV